MILTVYIHEEILTMTGLSLTIIQSPMWAGHCPLLVDHRQEQFLLLSSHVHFQHYGLARTVTKILIIIMSGPTIRMLKGDEKKKLKEEKTIL